MLKAGAEMKNVRIISGRRRMTPKKLPRKARQRLTGILVSRTLTNKIVRESCVASDAKSRQALVA
nr:MAG TPA: hypothetical protein [Caudoviricetes sp.]